MSHDPERLDKTRGSPLVRAMLTAGRNERPPHAEVQRAVVAVTTAIGVSSVAAGAAAGTASTAPLAAKGAGALIIAKWLGIGVVGGLATATAIVQLNDAPEPPPAAQVSPPALGPAVQLPPAPTSDEPVTLPSSLPSGVASTRGRTAATTAPASPTPAKTLADEVAFLDAARRLLKSGQPAQAVQHLSVYEGDFPARRLHAEVLATRMEAQHTAGNSTQAQALARQLLQTDAGGPHAARARKILSGE